jgi:hypothetical protein
LSRTDNLAVNTDTTSCSHQLTLLFLTGTHILRFVFVQATNSQKQQGFSDNQDVVPVMTT